MIMFIHSLSCVPFPSSSSMHRNHPHLHNQTPVLMHNSPAQILSSTCTIMLSLDSAPFALI
jgi:hypothetical protein